MDETIRKYKQYKRFFDRLGVEAPKRWVKGNYHPPGWEEGDYEQCYYAPEWKLAADFPEK